MADLDRADTRLVSIITMRSTMLLWYQDERFETIPWSVGIRDFTPLYSCLRVRGRREKKRFCNDN